MRNVLMWALLAQAGMAATIAGKFDDLGEDFRDVATGVVWRKPSEAVANRGEIYDTVWIGGYRWGLLDEVEALFANFDTESHLTDLQYTEELLELLGWTVFSFSARTNGWFMETDDPPLMGQANISYLIDGSTVRLTSEIRATGLLTHDVWARPLSSPTLRDDYGAWLVKSTVVPEPTGWILFGVALFGWIVTFFYTGD